MKIRKALQTLSSLLTGLLTLRARHEKLMLLNGRLLCRQNANLGALASIAEAEFSVFSQWGDDGIIQWLLRHIEFPNRTFIEFGVEDYRESNTRFLMMNNNWAGLVIDGSPGNIDRVTESEYFWKYDLQAISAFITAENINELILSSSLAPEVGILHIDLDGNDYWIWKAIHCVSPVVAIIEYNSVFGADRAITIPYDPQFQRTKSHSSNLYAGASLRALKMLADEKGYFFIGCNSAGNNAYFVRNEYLNEAILSTASGSGFVSSKFRESRRDDGSLECLSGQAREQRIKGMPVYNIESSKIEPF